MRYALSVLAVVLSTAAPPHAAAVKVGYCTSIRNVDAAKGAGFDYVEVSATEVAAMSDADFTAAAAHAKQIGMATPAANLFVPQTIKVVGPAIDVAQQSAHVKKVMSRLSTLGVEVLVFGSGGARSVPDGF